MTFIPRRRRLVGFTRRDALRLIIAGGLLIGSLTAILSFDVLPTSFVGSVGDIATREIRAQRPIKFVSDRETAARRATARLQVPPQYDYTSDKGFSSAERQAAAFDVAMAPVDAAFAAILPVEARATALAEALPLLSTSALATLQSQTAAEWSSLRSEMARVLQAAQRSEVRDTQLIDARATLSSRVAPRFDASERLLVGEILSPLLVANSTYDLEATNAAQDSAAAAIPPVSFTVLKDEIVVAEGEVIDETVYEKLEQLGLLDPRIDLAKSAGWFIVATALVVVMLGWIWRFRPEVWHRANSLLLLALVLILSAAALRVIGDRSVLPYFVPIGAVGLLLAVLIDSGTALVVLTMLGVVAGAITGTAELSAYILLGGIAGIIVVRRGERLGNFVQAAVAMAVINIAVVSAFTLIGERDLAGVLPLWGAALAAAGGS
ncbi:MAG: hypothetical protein ABIZ34_09145, partial [Candidatus Limnocylindrales bacterium]